jgi:SAM-dependent methyltransferase
MSFADAEAAAARMETPEREAWQQPGRVIDEVIRPLLTAATPTGKQPVLLEVGCGTGYFLSRLAAALPHAQVIGTDTEEAMRKYCGSRVAGCPNARVMPGGLKSAANGALSSRAHVLLLANTYHHMDHRVDWLRATAALDLAYPLSFLVIVEHKTGALPIPAPPEWMRLERGTIMAEAEAAGFTLAAAPSFLPHHSILVFQRESELADGGSGGSGSSSGMGTVDSAGPSGDVTDAVNSSDVGGGDPHDGHQLAPAAHTHDERGSSGSGQASHSAAAVGEAPQGGSAEGGASAAGQQRPVATSAAAADPAALQSPKDADPASSPK